MMGIQQAANAPTNRLLARREEISFPRHPLSYQGIRNDVATLGYADEMNCSKFYVQKVRTI